MSSRFLASKVTKTVKFMGLDCVISKLTVGQVNDIQSLAKAGEEKDNNIEILLMVIRSGVDELKDIDSEEFNLYPMDELVKLSNEIMKYSGLLSEKK